MDRLIMIEHKSFKTQNNLQKRYSIMTSRSPSSYRVYRLEADSQDLLSSSSLTFFGIDQPASTTIALRTHIIVHDHLNVARWQVQLNLWRFLSFHSGLVDCLLYWFTNEDAGWLQLAFHVLFYFHRCA